MPEGFSLKTTLKFILYTVLAMILSIILIMFSAIVTDIAFNLTSSVIHKIDKYMEVK